MKKIVITFLLSSVFSNFVRANFLKGRLAGFTSSFTANFKISRTSAEPISGKIYYQYPKKFHLKFTDGKILATNGKFIWIYNPLTYLSIRQDVGGSSGGLSSLLSSYKAKKRGKSFEFYNPEAIYQEVVLFLNSGGLLNRIKLKNKSEIITIIFSEVKIGVGIKSSLFNYRPPVNAQLIENPLNM